MPLYADAGREENIVAFALCEGARSYRGRAAASCPADGARDGAPIGEKAWGESRLPMEGEYLNVLTGERHEARGGHVGLAQILATFPVALLVRPEGC